MNRNKYHKTQNEQIIGHRTYPVSKDGTSLNFLTQKHGTHLGSRHIITTTTSYSQFIDPSAETKTRRSRMEALQREFNSEKQKSIALQSSYDDEKLLRLKTEDSLQQLRKIHETLACNCEMSEEFIVNKVLKETVHVPHRGSSLTFKTIIPSDYHTTSPSLSLFARLRKRNSRKRN